MKALAILAVAFLWPSFSYARAEEPQPPAPAAQAQPAPKAPLAKGPQPAAPKEHPIETTAKPGVNPDALVLLDFKQRIDKYVQIHKQAEKSAPPLKETKDPAKIQQAEEGLAASIRTARAGAKIGDIFTPEIRAKFRQLLYPEIKGSDGKDTKEILKDDAPKPSSIAYKPNAKYPEGAALPTVPPNLLLNLPTLPEELEYRIIGKHLILRDTKANIIVDFIPNAIR